MICNGKDPSLITDRIKIWIEEKNVFYKSFSKKNKLKFMF